MTGGLAPAPRRWRATPSESASPAPDNSRFTVYSSNMLIQCTLVAGLQCIAVTSVQCMVVTGLQCIVVTGV